MKKTAYALVIVACLLFISDWGWRNYVAFEEAKDGVRQVSVALSDDQTLSEFPVCRAQWGSNHMMLDECNRENRTGIAAFARAWNMPGKSANSGLSLIDCWRGSQVAGGTSWVIAGSCAGTASSI